MQLVSTAGSTSAVTLEEAILQGLAPDGGLYFPAKVPALPHRFLGALPGMTLHEIGTVVGSAFLDGEMSEAEVRACVERAFDFDAPLRFLSDGIAVLELFHGPTLAFKDFGARFMAELLGHFVKRRQTSLTILVATSGDTGGAVARGFYEAPGIDVVVLYPHQKISLMQEKQFTTLGKNVTALEIEGTFDDCQRLVKEAFADQLLRSKLSLTSANSINIARLIPQSFYYFRGLAQLPPDRQRAVFSVPSGNFGNLTAGLMAAAMGMPAHHFIAATNINDVVPRYLKSGVLANRPSQPTLSNAMDVGTPSNVARMQFLYGGANAHQALCVDVTGFSVHDEETTSTIKDVRTQFQYLLDPHSAVGYRALMLYLRQQRQSFLGEIPAIVLGTAHPAKFIDSIAPFVDEPFEIPHSLQWYLSREKQSVRMPAGYPALRDFLLERRQS